MVGVHQKCKNSNSKNHDMTPLISFMTDHANQYGHSNEFLAFRCIMYILNETGSQ